MPLGESTTEVNNTLSESGSITAPCLLPPFAGYYCHHGSNSSSPSLGYQADECPEGGHYCPLGSVTPQACPPGTYNSATRRQDIVDCVNCTGGNYCPEWNMTLPGPPCDAGYYCPSGADVATFLQCPPGSYCVEGSTWA